MSKPKWDQAQKMSYCELRAAIGGQRLTDFNAGLNYSWARSKAEDYLDELKGTPGFGKALVSKAREGDLSVDALTVLQDAIEVAEYSKDFEARTAAPHVSHGVGKNATQTKSAPSVEKSLAEQFASITDPKQRGRFLAQHGMQMLRNETSPQRDQSKTAAQQYADLIATGNSLAAGRFFQEHEQEILNFNQ